MERNLIIGTRGSKLALRQAEIVMERLKFIYPEFHFSLKVIKTKGDTIWDRPLHDIGEKGLFVREIEDALLRGDIHMAVHSMKDLPAETPQGLIVAAILEREDPRDALISFKFQSLSEVKAGSKIGTSSLRRKYQLGILNKGIDVFPLRGNIDTRIKRLEEGKCDAIIVAYAGLKRLDYEAYVREVIPLEILTPPSGQGAIGIETKAEERIIEFLRPLNHEKSFEEVMLERKLQSMIGGGCHTPLGINLLREDYFYRIHIFYGKVNTYLKLEENVHISHFDKFCRRILEDIKNIREGSDAL